MAWERLGGVLGRLGPSWGVLGASWGVLWAFWGRLGSPLGRLERKKVANMVPTWLPKRSQNREKIEAKIDQNFDASWGRIFEGFWWIWGGKMEARTNPSCPSRFLRCLGGLLGRLERSKGSLKASWTVLGASWARLGRVLGASWAVLGREWGPTWFQLGSQNGTKISLKSIPKLINFVCLLESIFD